MARWLVPLLPIGLALAIVTWWPRLTAPRPLAAVAPVRTHSVVAAAAAAAAAADDDDEDRLLAEAIDRVRGSTVALEYNSGVPGARRRVATGVVFTPSGDVISVRVEPKEGRDRESILARDSAGHEHPARFVAADPETGLTLLKVETKNSLPIRPIRPTARAAILGAAVFLVGHPYDLGQSVSVGNVAGLNRRVIYGPWTLNGLIHVQVGLHPGDSGALLADRKGGWIGLIRGGMATPDAKDDNTLGFAIPAPDALWIAEQLLAHRKVDRAYLGVQFGRDSTQPGAMVSRVVPGSPAEKAGLLSGDRIVRIDKWPIQTRDNLTDRLDLIAADTEVGVQYVRGDDLARLIVRTASRPSSTEPASKPLAETPPASALPSSPASSAP